MSLQQVIDTAQKIVFERRRVVGQTLSRSQRIKSAQRNTANPLALTVTPAAIFPYAQARDMVEGVMLGDRYQEFQVKLGNNTKTAYINEYRGSLTKVQIAAMTITNFTLTSVTIGGLPAIAGSVTSATIVFKSGDWIQPSTSRYPYIVTENVLRGVGSVVTATVHRNLITSEATTVTGTMLVGTDTTLKVIIADLPTYELGMFKFLSWSGDFKLVEKVI
jgi:hypothetical protein